MTSHNISIVLIVKNETKHLKECLESCAKIADEIIILDSGSTDDTLAIAQKFTDKIYSNTNWQGFGKQRKIAQSYASCDWVLMLDADERITPELAQEIKVTVQKNEQNMVYSLPRLSYAFGSFIKHGGWFPDYVERLYPRDKAEYNEALVHEKLQISNQLKVVKFKNHLLHYTYDSLEHYLSKSAQYSTAWAKSRFDQNKKSTLAQGIGHGCWYFFRMYLLKLGFLDGHQGLLLALLSAHSVFSKYANLWVMNQDKKKSK